MLDYSNSTVSTLDLLQSCAKSSKFPASITLNVDGLAQNCDNSTASTLKALVWH